MRQSIANRYAAAGALAASLAAGGAALADAPAPNWAMPQGHVAVLRRGPLAPGILPNVPSGGNPYAGVRPLLFPVPPPPPPVLVPPLVLDFEPVYFGPCWVATEHTAQFSHVGSCAESLYRQFTNEPD